MEMDDLDTLAQSPTNTLVKVIKFVIRAVFVIIDFVIDFGTRFVVIFTSKFVEFDTYTSFTTQFNTMLF